MKKPLFSVLIPVFKIEKYIEECVLSITNQSFSDFEIILIDDGSPDSCPEICERLRKNDSRIKVLHKKNEGVAKARRDGAEIAEGEYIICIDGDDWLKKDCLKTISKAINETHADIVCYGMICDNGREMIPCELPYKDGFYTREDIERVIFPELIQSNCAEYFAPSLCAKAIRKELFMENVLSNKLVPIGEDGACVIPCVYHCRSMFVLKECFYNYRYNNASATKSKKVYNWEYPQLIAEHLMSKVDIHYRDFQEQLDRKIVHDVFTVIVSQFNRDDPYSVIVKDIRYNLNKEIYHNAISQCRFEKSFKAILMQFVLKNNIYFPIFLYSKFKKY